MRSSCLPFLAALLLAAPSLSTYQIPARLSLGAVRGFVVIRSAEGKLIGNGEYTQIAHGDRVTSHLDLRFRDGSHDDEVTTFTQRKTLEFVSDHHTQSGPFFAHPNDTTIEAGGNVTIRTLSSDGKPSVETSHIDLPPNLANGFIAQLLLNASPTAPPFKLAMLAAVGKGRIMQLAVTTEPKSSFTIAGRRRTATIFRLHPELGGLTGMIAPLIGKQPDDAYAWIEEGEVPVIVREVAQLAQDGPVVSIELAGATFPTAASAKH